MQVKWKWILIALVILQNIRINTVHKIFLSLSGNLALFFFFKLSNVENYKTENNISKRKKCEMISMRRRNWVNSAVEQAGRYTEFH